MEKENKEQLKELLEKFYSEAEAVQMAEDIETGEKLIRDYPVLEPAETTKWRIKASISKQLRAKKQHALRARVYQALSVAAVIVVVALTVKFIEKPGTNLVPTLTGDPPIVFNAMNTNTSVYSQEIDQIQRQVASLQFGQTADEQLNSVDELETEYIIIASDFWKGD
jgi:hypothetical protein